MCDYVVIVCVFKHKRLTCYHAMCFFFPCVHSFLPPLEDPAVPPSTIFTPLPRRRSLFQGKRFAFLHRSQYEKLHDLVVAASGLPVLYDSAEAARERQQDLKFHLNNDVVRQHSEAAP